MNRNPTLPAAKFTCRNCNRRTPVRRNTVVGLECRVCADWTHRRQGAATTIDVETPHEHMRRVDYGFG